MGETILERNRREVEYWLTHESCMEFREIKLFYDGFDPNDKY